MATILAVFLPLLALTATAAPAPTPSTTYTKNTTLSFSQSTFPYTAHTQFSASITPLLGEGACYPHIYETAFLGQDNTQLLNFTTTAATNPKTGRTPINAIDIGGGCWGLDIETGILVVRAGAQMKGWFVDSEGKLGNEKAPYGFYYCYDTTGQGVVGVEDKARTHNGQIYGVCFDFELTAFETPK